MAKVCRDIPLIVHGERQPGPPGEPCPSVCPPGPRGEMGLKGLPGDPGQYSYRLEGGGISGPGGCFYYPGIHLGIQNLPTLYINEPFFYHFGTATGGSGIFTYDLMNRPSWMNWNAKYRFAWGNIPGDVPTGFSNRMSLRYQATDVYTGETVISDTDPVYLRVDDRPRRFGVIPYPIVQDTFYFVKGQPFTFSFPAPILRYNPSLEGATMLVLYATSATASFRRNSNLAGTSWINVSQKDQVVTMSGTAPTAETIEANKLNDDGFLRQDVRVYPTGASSTTGAFWVSIYIIDPIGFGPPLSTALSTVQRSVAGAGGAGDLVSYGNSVILSRLVTGGSGNNDFHITKLPSGFGSLETVCYTGGLINFDNTSGDTQPPPGSYNYTIEALDINQNNPDIENMVSRDYQFIVPPRRN